MTSRAEARQAVRSQYFFVANEEEAFSVFGRSEVQDINRIRSCTDIPYLIAFLMVCGAMLMLNDDATRLGNVLRLFEPIDFQGRLCGYDKGVEDKRLGYFPNPYNDMVVCVSVCPKTGGDGNFTLPDGPMGKFYTRRAYPTAQIYGQHCLPLDLELAKRIIATKSVQSEIYKALGSIAIASDVMLIILLVPAIMSFILIIMLLFVPNAAATLAFSCTGVTLALTGLIMDLDQDVLMGIPLYKETHPVEIAVQPYYRDVCYGSSIMFMAWLALSVRIMGQAAPVFKVNV